MSLLFNRATMIEAEIESLLDDISKSGLLFTAAIKDYLNNNKERFKERKLQIEELESNVDSLRRGIRHKLYSKMLIPESRGDVLSLLENIDNVIDATKEILIAFDIEHPNIPEQLKQGFIELAEASASALDSCVLAARSFFKNITMINDYINKTYFFEHEADKIEYEIKRKIFSSDEFGDLAQKMHIKNFVEHIAKLSDEAEDVCERLSVAAIKRSI